MFTIYCHIYLGFQQEKKNHSEQIRVHKQICKLCIKKWHQFFSKIASLMLNSYLIFTYNRNCWTEFASKFVKNFVKLWVNLLPMETQSKTFLFISWFNVNNQLLLKSLAYLPCQERSNLSSSTQTLSLLPFE